MISLRLRGDMILERSGASNVHQLSLRSGVSYPTVEKYIRRPEDIQALDLGVLLQVLVDGCGMTLQQVAELRVGDLFEIEVK